MSPPKIVHPLQLASSTIRRCCRLLDRSPTTTTHRSFFHAAAISSSLSSSLVVVLQETAASASAAATPTTGKWYHDHHHQMRWFTNAGSTTDAEKKSPFDDNRSTSTSNETTTTTPLSSSKTKKRRNFVPPKAAVKLTPKARQFFKLLLENPPRSDIVGIMLNYNQASSGQPRMVFTFDFVSQNQISDDDEGVSLEVLEDGEPKPPKDSIDDGLPKLYVNHNGFMKVLGCTLDVDIDNMKPILYDPEGNIRDPNL